MPRSTSLGPGDRREQIPATGREDGAIDFRIVSHNYRGRRQSSCADGPREAALRLRFRGLRLDDAEPRVRVRDVHPRVPAARVPAAILVFLYKGAAMVVTSVAIYEATSPPLRSKARARQDGREPHLRLCNGCHQATGPTHLHAEHAAEGQPRDQQGDRRRRESTRPQPTSRLHRVRAEARQRDDVSVAPFLCYQSKDFRLAFSQAFSPFGPIEPSGPTRASWRLAHDDVSGVDRFECYDQLLGSQPLRQIAAHSAPKRLPNQPSVEAPRVYDNSVRLWAGNEGAEFLTI